jgi:hypothetical protein
VTSANANATVKAVTVAVVVAVKIASARVKAIFVSANAAIIAIAKLMQRKPNPKLLFGFKAA